MAKATLHDGTRQDRENWKCPKCGTKFYVELFDCPRCRAFGDAENEPTQDVAEEVTDAPESPQEVEEAPEAQEEASEPVETHTEAPKPKPLPKPLRKRSR